MNKLKFHALISGTEEEAIFFREGLLTYLEEFMYGACFYIRIFSEGDSYTVAMDVFLDSEIASKVYAFKSGYIYIKENYGRK